jgi:Phage integrase, N-terminal SAM-like domain
MTSLRNRMIEDMQIRNLAVHPQNTYVLQVSMFARHFSRSPELLGPEEIRTYQVYLTNEKKLAVGSILIAIGRGNQSMEGTRLGSAGPAARQRLHLGPEEQGQVSGHDRGRKQPGARTIRAAFRAEELNFSPYGCWMPSRTC